MTPPDQACLGLSLLRDLLDGMVPALMEEHHTPGVSLALFDKPGHTLVRSYGVADASTGQPVTPDTIFEAASLSKPLFALLVLELAAQGVLDLDRPLADYVAEPFADDPQIGAITARHVLCHRTGLPNWTKDGEAVKVHATLGTEFAYSGLGYVYLLRAVERLTRHDLQQPAGSCVPNGGPFRPAADQQPAV